MRIAPQLQGLRGGKKLRTFLPIHVWTGNVAAQTWNSLALGEEDPNRVFYLLYGARTNTTTGARYMLSASLTVGGTVYPFTALTQAVNVANGIWKVAIPAGTIGNLYVKVSGNATGWVSADIVVYSALGPHAVLGAGATGTQSSEANGVYFLFGYSAGGTVGAVTNITQETTVVLNGMTAKSGRFIDTAAGTHVGSIAAASLLSLAIAQR